MDNQARPIYNNRVRVSNWQEPYEAFPLDNEHPVKLESHYKSLGPTNEFHVRQSTTKEAMEGGMKKLSSSKATRRSAVNFTSYPLIDTIIDKFEQMKQNPIVKIQERPISTYNMEYVSVYNNKEPFCRHAESPHFLFNRIPKNYFTSTSPTAPHKFMDNHLYDNTNEARNCINQMRQIRNASNIF